MPPCKECSQRVRRGDRYCNCCDNSLAGGSDLNIETGTGSSNVGVGIINRSRIQHIENQYNSNPDEKIPTLEYVNNHRTSVRRVWLTAIGTVGSLASILSLLLDSGLFGGSWSISLLPFFLFGFSLVLFLVGCILRDSPIPLGKCALYSDDEDNIHFAEVTGQCPKSNCNGQLSLISTTEENSKVKKLRCSQYPERHQFPFYPSELPEGPSSV